MARLVFALIMAVFVLSPAVLAGWGATVLVEYSDFQAGILAFLALYCFVLWAFLVARFES